VAIKEEKIKRTDKKVSRNKKHQLILAAMAVFLIAGSGVVLLQKKNKSSADSADGNLYGFEFKPGPAENLKSVQHGSQIIWTLKNDTDISLEIKWYDPEGRPKISDQLKRELSELGPGKTLRGITYRGHVFGLFDHDKNTMLGSFRFVSGDNLNLVVEKDGERVAVNPKYLRKAVSGDGLAQAQLSEAFWAGNGLPQNNQEAAKWAKKSFEQGNSFGICMLAACLDMGAGVPQDSALSLQYWRRAADAGEGWAYARLGDRYLNGYGGVSRNYQEAIPLLERAVEKGNHWAMINLAKAYENGLGVEENLEKAKNLYLKAAESDYPGTAEDAKKRLDEMRKRIDENVAKETVPQESISSANPK